MKCPEVCLGGNFPENVSLNVRRRMFAGECSGGIVPGGCTAVFVSCGNAWERRSHTYFGRGNAVPTLSY